MEKDQLRNTKLLVVCFHVAPFAGTFNLRNHMKIHRSFSVDLVVPSFRKGIKAARQPYVCIGLISNNAAQIILFVTGRVLCLIV